MEDLLIRRSTVYDGSGEAPFAGSLTVKNGIITGVYRAEAPPMRAAEEIDARGRALCPGFVDTHTHSDMTLLHDGRQHASLSQGVTTEILGQDGLSYAPMSRANLNVYAPYLKGLNGQFDDVALDFETVGEYLSRYRNRVGVNIAWLLPHCALRLETAGFENRLLTDKELDRACDIAREAISQGACGFSTGLSYYPGAFSDTRELIAICKAVKEAGGVYVTHLRTVFRGRSFSAVEEALTIARETGVPLHFSHFRTGGDTIGHADALLEPIDRAVREGLDVTLELYPYPYGASYAPMFVPMWANDGGMKEILKRLSDKAERARIAREIDESFAKFDGVITYAAHTPGLMGKSFGEIAASRGMSKGETIAELLLSEELALSFHDVDPELSAMQREQFDRDVLSLLKRPYYMVGSDAIHVGRYPHPRGCGSFARLWRVAREHGFAYETLIERMAALPSRRFGLKNRGMLRTGYRADMVLLRPEDVCDRATNEEPRLPPLGVDECWVNGVRALRNGRPTDALAGQVLPNRREP